MTERKTVFITKTWLKSKLKATKRMPDRWTYEKSSGEDQWLEEDENHKKFDWMGRIEFLLTLIDEYEKREGYSK
jgi:hypothetical protein